MSVILGYMSTLTEPKAGSPRPAAQGERIRMASFGALTMLILQFALGTAYNLYGTAPTAAKSIGMFSSPLLAIHVVLGILLIVAAAMLVFRAVQAKAAPVLATSIVGLVAVLGAAGAGSAFAGNGNNGASLGMALATAVAMLCYAANLVILGKPRG
jgi:heme A synthase